MNTSSETDTANPQPSPALTEPPTFPDPETQINPPPRKPGRPKGPTPSKALLTLEACTPDIRSYWRTIRERGTSLAIPATVNLCRSHNFAYPEETIRSIYKTHDAFAARVLESMVERDGQTPKPLVLRYLQILHIHANHPGLEQIASNCIAHFGFRLLTERLIAGN